MPECPEKKSQNVVDALLNCLTVLLVIFGGFVGLSFLYGILSGVLGGILGALIGEIIALLFYLAALLIWAMASLDQYIGILEKYFQ